MENKLNSSADRDRRQRWGATRGRDLYWGFTIGIFSNLVTLYIVANGDGSPAIAISAMVLGTFIFVMINSFDCMDDLKANAEDMDAVEAETNFGSKFKKAPWGMFKAVVTIVFGGAALTQFGSVWGFL